jgi:hypothetical protein
MKKFQKYFDWEECPLCGHSLVITTDCDPANDTEQDVAYQDGDLVNCENQSCTFESELSVDEFGHPWLKETYDEED